MLCLALAAWLFWPRRVAGRDTAPRLRVALVDVSASTVRARGWLPWVRAELREQAGEARAAGQELAVVSFANGLATGFGPGDPARFLEELEGRAGAPFEPMAELGQEATLLAAALEGVEPWLSDPTRPAGELALLGPLTFTGRSPVAVLARLRAAGVALAPRAPPAAEESDLGLLELVLAPRVERGAPLVALARLVLRRGTATLGTARLSLESECDGVVHERSFELALPGVDGEFELPLEAGPAGPGRNELRARVSWSSGPDPLSENDRAQASCVATGAGVIGVAVSPEARAAAEEWLAPRGRSRLAGLQFAFYAPSELEERLAELDAVVSFDLATGELAAPLLAAFVRRGGGWLALAGWRFLGDWIPGASGTLESLLPCEPAGSESRPRDVVLLVDGSGSMEGAAFESVRAAALELVAAALPSDRVSLRFFGERLEPEQLLKERSSERMPEAARAALRGLLQARVPTGATLLLRSLSEFRATVGEHETLLLLLTDGWDREAGANERGAAERVGAELRAARVRPVVIGVGQPNLGLLAALAGGAHHVQGVSSFGDLQAVFRRELHAPRLREGELELGLATRAPGSLADEVASAASPSSPSSPMHAPLPLERFVRNRLRAGGEALWTSADGEPVLSLARAGLGRTAFFASRPGAGWASRHARDAESFAGLLRWLVRGPEREEQPRARLASDVLRVTGLSARTPVELRAELLGGGGARVLGERTLLPPDQLGFDVLHTRQATQRREEWAEDGLFLRLGGGLESELLLAVERSLPDEFAGRERGVSAAWLSPESTPRSSPAGGATGSRPAALLAVVLGLALLFAAGVAGASGSRSSRLQPIDGRSAKERPSPEILS